MEALRFGREMHLVAVLHRPTGEDKRRGVLLWNTGISGRVGPYRLNFEIAKILADQGYTVLRFDLAQLGDSDATLADVDIQRRTSADIRDAVDLLENRFAIGEVVLIGLCSSAVDAYYYAKDDRRVRGLVMVDGFVYPTRGHRYRLFWHRVTSLYRWGRMLRKVFSRGLPELPQDYFEANYPAPAEASREIQTMLAEGKKLLVAFTDGFLPFFSYTKQYFHMLPGLRPSPNLDVRLWLSVDHLFILEEDRRFFLNSLTDWMQKHFASPVDEHLQLSEEVLSVPAVEEPGEKISPEKEASPPAKTEGPQIAAADLLACFREVLHSRIIEEEDSFFEYGGNSILALRLITLIEEKLAFKLPLVALYSYPEAQKLSAAIARNEFSDDVLNEAPRKAPKADESPLRDDIAIIGMACHVPGAKNVDEFWSIVREGRETIRHFSPDELDSSLPSDLRQHPNYVPSRGVIEGDRFDANFFRISPREATLTDPQQRILLECCWNALEDAGYSATRSKKTIAIYAGTGANSYLSRNLMSGNIDPHTEEETLALLLNDKDYVATRIAYHMDLKGPAVSVHAACSTSLVAVIEAIKCLQSGQAEIALAGAASVNAPIASGHLYQEGGIFSKDGHCRPFDAGASGTMFSDGAAVLVLKPLQAALRDKDPIHAVIRGWGINNDGANKSSFAAPSVHGQAEAIRMALASIDPESIGYLEAHGTATPIGDPIEIEALKRAYGKKKKQYCAIGSVKANIGHLTAAAGAIGLIKAALCVREKFIPAQTHFQEANPNLRLEQTPFYIPREGKAWKGLRRAGISSFGVGGTNSHVVIEEAPPRESPSLEEDDPWTVLTWSARDEEACKRLGESILKSSVDPKDLSYTLEKTRSPLPFVQAVCRHPSLSVRSAKAPVALPASKRPLILCFSGQGNNYGTMGSDLANIWPRFGQNYNAILNLFANEHGVDLRSRLKSVEEFQETRFVQPALFSLQWALAQSLLESGLEVAAMIGHSLGEVSAAMAAGVFDLRSAAAFIVERSRAMQSAEAGQMLAVRATLAEIEGLLSPGLDIAAINSERSLVLSGPESSVAAFQSRIEGRGIAQKLLAASHAFHSTMMEPILPKFREAIKDIKFHRPNRKMISTVTGKILSARECMDPEYWLQQIRNPVRFANAVETAVGLHPGALFLEIGPKDALTRFVQQILKSEQSATASLPQRNNASEGEDIAAMIADLWCAGHRPFAVTDGLIVSAPPYPFRGERLWLDPKIEGKTMQKTRSSSSTPAEQGSGLALHSERGRALELLAKLVGVNVQTISTKQGWLELGMDSLLLTQWALKVQREFGIDMNLQRLQTDVPTLEALLRLIPNHQREEIGRELPVLNDDAGGLDSLDPASYDLVRHVMDQQFQLMNRQLDVLQRLTGYRSEGSLTPKATDNFAERLESLPIEGEHLFQRDKGPARAPKYKGSFLAQDASGETSVFIEDPDNPGQYWQIIHD